MEMEHEQAIDFLRRLLSAERKITDAIKRADANSDERETLNEILKDIEPLKYSIIEMF